MVKRALVCLAALTLAGCSSDPPPPRPTFSLPARPVPPCSELEPSPVDASKSQHVSGPCSDPGGPQRYVNAFYQCTDGRVWLVLSELKPPASPPEPTGEAFDQCLGR